MTNMPLQTRLFKRDSISRFRAISGRVQACSRSSSPSAIPQKYWLCGAGLLVSPYSLKPIMKAASSCLFLSYGLSSDTKNRPPTTSRIAPLFHSDKVVGWGRLPGVFSRGSQGVRAGRDEGPHTCREAGRSQRACRSFPSLPPRRESAGNGGRKRRFTLSDMQKFSSPYKGT